MAKVLTVVEHIMGKTPRFPTQYSIQSQPMCTQFAVTSIVECTSDSDSSISIQSLLLSRVTDIHSKSNLNHELIHVRNHSIVTSALTYSQVYIY